eukprot:TRINITY_DN533_c0_g1_i1.p1 TRINITY_DN533_c0_g1~~TRINITY_DN533_c0_g1_i1.p1  ORF type:complete len:261 (+),score=101.54 TRINITY_DN533_c0_g1_i1:566-1348(+)
MTNTLNGIIQTIYKTNSTIEQREEEEKKKVEEIKEIVNPIREKNKAKINTLQDQISSLKKQLSVVKRRSNILTKSNTMMSSISRLENTEMKDMDTSLSSDLPNPLMHVTNPNKKSIYDDVEDRLSNHLHHPIPIMMEKNNVDVIFDAPPPPPPPPPMYVPPTTKLIIVKSDNNTNGNNRDNGRLVLDLNAILSVKLKPTKVEPKQTQQNNNGKMPAVSLSDISNIKLKKRSNNTQETKNTPNKTSTPPFARIQLKKNQVR